MRPATLVALAVLLAAAAPVPIAPGTPIEAPGPQGALAGTFVRPAGTQRAAALILPGSGPTDRDGNSPLGIRAQPYRLLAQGLAEAGIASVRIDKRGMFASRVAWSDANAVTLDAYVADTRAWVGATLAATGARCVWLVGHSEGGLIALASAGDPRVCGLVLIATPGRKLGDVLRTQLRATPANAPILADAERVLGELEHARRVPEDKIPAVLAPLFRPQVQGFLISMFAFDPVRALAGVYKPVLIVAGGRDLQVGREDAAALIAADAKAKLAMFPEANHVLKRVRSDDVSANLATYADPALPLAPGVVDAVAGFMTAPR